MKKYNAIIFDLDGVICHTDQYHYEAWKAVADELGIYFDEAINNRLRGVSRMESFEIILERYEKEMSEADKERWITKKNEIYKALLKNMSPADLSVEVKETLDGLRESGISLQLDHQVRMQDSFWDSWVLENILMRFRMEIIFQNQNRIRKYS